MRRSFTNKLKQVFFRQWSNKKYAVYNSLRKTIKICTLVVAYSIIAKSVHVKAQGSDTTNSRILELDEVTVQSTLIELKNAETGRSIEIINGSQLQSVPVTTIDELLRYVPGVDAQQRGAFGAQTDFSLRGSNFNQVLILIDGQKINDPLTSHFNSNIPVSPSEIERIEIIKGPASTEYGPDATGGVINIITKTFSKNIQAEAFMTDAKVLLGQYHLINTDGGIFYGFDKFCLSGGFLLNKSDGNPLTSGLKNFFNINTFSLSGRIQLNLNWSLSYRYAKDYRDFNAQWFYTTYAGDKATEKIDRQRHQFQLTRNSVKSKTKIRISYINTDDRYLYKPGAAPNENSSNYTDFLATHEIKVSSFIATLIGATIQQRKVNSTDRGNHALAHHAGFATIFLKPVEKFNVNTGLRADFDQKYGSYLLPQAGLSYEISKKIVLRASAGYSIRTPDFTEGYSNNFRNDTLGSGSSVGNPNLTVEKSWSYETGCDLKLFKNSLFSLTGFYRKATGIIDYVWTDAPLIHVNSLIYKPGASFWFAQNNSLVNILGVESRISFRQKISSIASYKLTGGYTFIYKDENFDQPSRYASLTPKHLLNWAFEAELGPVTMGINGLYKFRKSQWNEAIQRYLKQSYAIWNSSIDVAVYKKNIFMSVDVTNIFNEDYSDFIGAEMPGRWISVGLQLKF
jgi:vitamin B12 transporter